MSTERARPVQPGAGVKIGFVLLSNSRDPQPSTRIAVLNMLPHLRRAGFEPHIVHDPVQGTPQPELTGLADRLAAAGFRIVVFQKVHGPGVEAQVHRLRALGIRTVFSICDHVIVPMVQATDATLAVTDYLRGLHPAELLPRIHVVHDGIERASVLKVGRTTHRGARAKPLSAVLVTSASPTRIAGVGSLPEWLAVTIVGRYAQAGRPLRGLREMRWALARQNLHERLEYLGFLLDPRVRRVPWDPVGVYGHLVDADIGIIPVETGADAPSATWRVKSENRLTLKMSIGLPVIATPIPAYESVVEHGVNGFLARTARDWQRCFAALRDPELRRTMGQRARGSVIDRFGQERQASRLVAVLEGLLAQAEHAPRATGPQRG